MGAKVLNATYKILHADNGNVQRNYCAEQIKDVLHKDYEPLNSPTVFLSNFDEANKYLENLPNLKFNTIPNYSDNGAPWPTSSGAMGIWISTYLAFKKFLESSKDILFIFEDDALISVNFINVIEGYIKELPKDWHFFTAFVPENCLSQYNSSHNIEGNEKICKSYQDWSCAGYAISREGARKTIEDIEANKIGAPLDWYVFNVNHLGTEKTAFNTYAIKPTFYSPVRLAPVAVQSTVHDGATEGWLR